MDTQTSSVNQERPGRTVSGWGMLAVTIVLCLGGAALFILGIVRGSSSATEQPVWALFVPGLVAMILGFIAMSGFFTLQPNEARVLILFGAYKGTARKTGFLWANPFYSNGPSQPTAGQAQGQKSGFASAAMAAKQATGGPTKGQKRYKISLRARTLNGDKLKVNDTRGNPIEIAPWWYGECTTPPRPSSTSTTTRHTSACRVSPPSVTLPAPTRTITVRTPKPRARSRCAATSRRYRRHFVRSCSSAWPRPA